MYSRELSRTTNNDTEKKGNETADDVKIYIRHNAGGIVKDFYENFKIEKASRKFLQD